MENFNMLYVLLIVIIIALTVRNVIQVKKIKNEGTFVNVYSKILKRDLNAYEEIKNYVAQEKDEALKNKARLLLIYEMMMNNEDPMDVAEETNLDALFTTKGIYNAKLANRNSDVFIWLALVFAKARNTSMFDVIGCLTNKINQYEKYFEKQLEYHLFRGICSAIAERNDVDSAFLGRLLNGDYVEMTYDQKLIGLYKRIAACYLVYLGDVVDEYFENDLHKFASTSIGRCLMSDLEIIDKYPPMNDDEVAGNIKTVNDEDGKEEVVEENKEETIEENKEKNIEETEEPKE